MNIHIFPALVSVLLLHSASAQVNTGSDGHDGALNPTADLVINMADHPDGIYHYTSVNIPTGVTVSFVPNAANTPVVWLAQDSCVISGSVDVSGLPSNGTIGGAGGPGGWRGGSGGSNPSAGQGPGGGSPGYIYGGSGFFNYGNSYLLPLLGGSGGGGNIPYYDLTFGGDGGGGAILIAASHSINLSGSILAKAGGNATNKNGQNICGGSGSGGAVRIVTLNFTGGGIINAAGGNGGGPGRIRIDSFQNTFGGTTSGTLTQGFQPIILPATGQGIQLSISSISGAAVSPTPSGVLANPDVIIPAQQSNPIPVVVSCTNLPLNSEISVTVHPANGPDIHAVGLNNAGTLEASTATISINMPRGGGIIYAKCVSGLAGLGADDSSKDLRTKSLAETGWTTDGERFAKVEVVASLGGQQQLAYITESGKRYALAVR
jgi:hypothetical protein